MLLDFRRPQTLKGLDLVVGYLLILQWRREVRGGEEVGYKRVLAVGSHKSRLTASSTVETGIRTYSSGKHHENSRRKSNKKKIALSILPRYKYGLHTMDILSLEPRQRKDSTW